MPTNLSIEQGVPEIYRKLTVDYGLMNIDWKLLKQSSLRKDEKWFDVMEIQLKNGKKYSVFFDKTEIGKKYEELFKNLKKDDQ